ncbi:NUDIX hydrolase domain-like protein [Ilyonectria robusta]|uniref:NUDIX hydrolase domain-like protein n=1 Tax=Ilyonectria robusta TaxID=1079257 RepID=UPI001E8CA20E|nr:NUDIX hydrolase domain-like protein [Ilyonectria robusta]KAH8662741.1 NUDIX hydrolase domain-like protein [Ilyonectria robusta]
MPHTWEVPGGAVDKGDPTILHACARELWEEAGLKVRRINHVILDGAKGKPGATFMNSTGKSRYCKFSFQVEVDDTGIVKLDPNEHQAFLWATEEEVKTQEVGDRKIPLANSMMENLLRVGFEMWRRGEGAIACCRSGEGLGGDAQAGSSAVNSPDL